MKISKSPKFMNPSPRPSPKTHTAKKETKIDFLLLTNLPGDDTFLHNNSQSQG